MFPSLPRWLALAAGLASCGADALAFEVAIRPGVRAIYLQVGAGTISGGTFSGGGTPQDNTTVNRVSVAVAPDAIAAGAVPMASNSTVTASPYDGRPFCTANQVYVGGYFRRAGPLGGDATLSVSTTAASLVNAAGDTIPFTSISWTSGGIGDTVAVVPSGTFTGGTQTLLTIARNIWFESCLSFQYANAQSFAAGTFTGRAIYTLSAP